MKKEFDFLSTTLALALITTACNSKQTGSAPIDLAPNVAPQTNTVTNFTPTFTPTEIRPSPTPTIEDRFNYGGLDIGNIKFEIILGEELKEFANIKTFYDEGGNEILPHADHPLRVVDENFAQDDEFTAPFRHASEDNTMGNPFFVLLTDLPNTWVLYFHTYQFDSPADSLTRELGGFAYRHPDQLEELYTKTFTITINGTPMQARVANVVTISGAYFDNLEETSPYGIFTQDGVNVPFIRTDMVGTPDSVRNNGSPKKINLIIAGCQNATPGAISIAHDAGRKEQRLTETQATILNSTNRTLVTIEVTLP